MPPRISLARQVLDGLICKFWLPSESLNDVHDTGFHCLSLKCFCVPLLSSVAKKNYYLLAGAPSSVEPPTRKALFFVRSFTPFNTFNMAYLCGAVTWHDWVYTLTHPASGAAASETETHSPVNGLFVKEKTLFGVRVFSWCRKCKTTRSAKFACWTAKESFCQFMRPKRFAIPALSEEKNFVGFSYYLVVLKEVQRIHGVRCQHAWKQECFRTFKMSSPRRNRSWPTRKPTRISPTALRTARSFVLPFRFAIDPMLWVWI